MEAQRSDKPAISVEKDQVIKKYETPHLIVHGTVQDLTKNPGGTSVDGFGGSAPII